MWRNGVEQRGKSGVTHSAMGNEDKEPNISLELNKIGLSWKKNVKIMYKIKLV